MGDEHGHDEGADVFGSPRYGRRWQIAKGHAVVLSFTRVFKNKLQAVKATMGWRLGGWNARRLKKA
jgi:hypothetical protein